MRGDWGELDDEDRAQNETSLITGKRLLSSYTLDTGTKVWVITEADRSVTTILLPDEY
ncbi:plasmid related protein [Cupriavidus sp. D384]|uniref:plasmid related protein n=1 Tax=Cupriavidus sp. D384 TaxID=1538095 RepID=UPI000AAFDD4E